MASEALTVSSSKKRRNRRGRRQQDETKNMIRLAPERPPTPTAISIESGPTIINSHELQLRFLNPGDLPEVKRLCHEWFPIEYPDTWYTDITSTQKFYSVAAVYRGQIVGLVVAEIKDGHALPKEDSEILASTFDKSSKIGYILSLGVVKGFRKQGIASFLLENLIAHLTTGENSHDVKAVYLHVLTTNNAAITFYEHRGFRPHLFLPYYYAIGGRRRDGFTYVLYLNGGHPPWRLLDYMSHCCQICLSVLNPWSLTKAAFRKVNLAWFNAMPRIRQIAHGTTAVFS